VEKSEEERQTRHAAAFYRTPVGFIFRTRFGMQACFQELEIEQSLAERVGRIQNES
jgi:hypothetical protein